MPVMEKITAEIAARVKSDNPGKKLHLIRVTHGEAIFRVPDSDTWDTYWDMLTGPAEGRGSAPKHLVFGSVVYPPIEQFRKAIEERPGLVQAFYDPLTEVAGQTKAIESKEL
jgi:hypothetical protein